MAVISLAAIARSLFLYLSFLYLYHGLELPGAPTVAAAAHRLLPLTIRSLDAQDSGQQQPPVRGKALICYYDNQTMRSVTRNRLLAEDIDSTLCTHLIYRHGEFSIFEEGVWWPTESEADFERASLKSLKTLKLKNPKLKILLSLGGFRSGGESLEDVSRTPQSREEFIGNSTEFLKKFQLDGISLAWSFHDDHLLYNEQHLQESLKDKFNNLLRDLRRAFDAEGFILTSQIEAKKSAIDSGYDLATMSRYLDYIILDAHHFNRYDRQRTGPNSALYSSKEFDLNEEDARGNVNWSVNYLLANGAPRDKLILGISLDGVARKLEDASQENGYNAATSEIRQVKEKNSQHIRHEWMDRMSYDKLCEKLKSADAEWQIVRDTQYKVPYATRDNLWISYDDIMSVMSKARYANSMGLAGVSVFSLDRDDYSGACHPETFPLTRAAKVALNMPVAKPKPTTTTTTRRPVRALSTTTAKPPARASKRPPVRPKTTTRQPEVMEDDDMMMTDEATSARTTEASPRGEEDDMMMTTEATRSNRKPVRAREPASESTTPKPTSSPKPTPEPKEEEEAAAPELDDDLLKIPVNPKAPEVTLRQTARLIQRSAAKKCDQNNGKTTTTTKPLTGHQEEHTHEPEADEHTHKPEVEVQTTKPEVEAHTHKPEVEAHTHKPEVEEHTHKPEVEAQTKRPKVKATTKAPTTTTTTEDPAEAQPQCPDSKGSKQLPGPGCRKYYDCSSGELELKVCRDDLVWNRELGYCDERDNVATCK